MQNAGGNPVEKRIEAAAKPNIALAVVAAILPLAGGLVAFVLWIVVIGGFSGPGYGFSLRSFWSNVPRLQILGFALAVILSLLLGAGLLLLRGLGKRIHALLPLAAAALPWLVGTLLTRTGFSDVGRAASRVSSASISAYAAGNAEASVWRIAGTLFSCLLFLAVAAGFFLIAMGARGEKRSLKWLFISGVCGLPLLAFTLFWMLAMKGTWVLVFFAVVALVLFGLAGLAGKSGSGVGTAAGTGLAFLAAAAASSAVYVTGNYAQAALVTDPKIMIDMSNFWLFFFVGGLLALLPALVLALRAAGSIQPRAKVLGLALFPLLLAAVILPDYLVCRSSPGYLGGGLPELYLSGLQGVSAPPPPPPPPPPAAAKKSIETPQEIEQEDIKSIGIEGGIEGGVEGGVVGGVLGGVEGKQLSTDVSDAIRISASKAKLVHRVDPVYPQIALAARIQGVVVVEAVTDIFGKVREAKVISGHPLLNDAALTTVRQWIYEPYMVDGVPKAARFTVTVNFTLPGK